MKEKKKRERKGRKALFALVGFAVFALGFCCFAAFVSGDVFLPSPVRGLESARGVWQNTRKHSWIKMPKDHCRSGRRPLFASQAGGCAWVTGGQRLLRPWARRQHCSHRLSGLWKRDASRYKLFVLICLFSIQLFTGWGYKETAPQSWALGKQRADLLAWATWWGHTCAVWLTGPQDSRERDWPLSLQL